MLSDPRLRAEYDAETWAKSAQLRSRNEAGGAMWDAASFSQHADTTFRKSMFDANSRFRKGAASRGALNRARRERIDVPTQRETWKKLMFPAAMVGIWVFNYFAFMNDASPISHR